MNYEPFPRQQQQQQVQEGPSSLLANESINQPDSYQPIMRSLSKLRYWHLLLLIAAASSAMRGIQAFSILSHKAHSRHHGAATTCTVPPRPLSPLLMSHAPDSLAVPPNYTSSTNTAASSNDDNDKSFSLSSSSSSSSASLVEQQQQQQQQPMIPPKPKTSQVCILLNTNARSVTPRVVETAKAVLGESNVFVTQTAQQAQQAATQILKQGYSVVIPVGGDGTLSSLVNMLCAAQMMPTKNDSSNCPKTLEQAMATIPTVAYIPLGTGNGVGSVVGNSVAKKKWGIFPSRRKRQQQLTSTLQRLQALGQELALGNVPYDHEEYERIDVPMMEVITNHSFKNDKDDKSSSKHHGDLCFFAGVGFDSLMLNDFKRIKAWSIRTGFLTRTLSSVTGYCVALIVRTLPQTVWQGRHNIHVRVTTNHVNSTLWVDHRRGDVVRPVRDALLYDGITGILAAGTSPFYGGGLRLFPFARLTVDQMHLRVGRIHPLTGFFNIPQIFAGTYRDKSDRLGCLDFIGDEFQVQVEPASNVVQQKNNRQTSKDNDDDHAGYDNTKGYPFQHSGESVGHVEKFRLRVVKEPVRFICLKKKPSGD